MVIIGHETIRKDLQKLAARGALSHSLLFFGPAMVGKKTVALEFARGLERGALRKEESGTREVHDTILNDMMIIEPSGSGSIGIDAVRDIKNFLWQKPNVSPRRTLIINDAELLTAEAQNALLKVTEEPPASALLILIAADPESLMPTILSRFQKIYFGLVPEKEIVAWLEQSKIENRRSKATNFGLHAKKAMGKPGLAWRITHDEDFRAAIELAEKFLKSAAGAAPLARRDLIKKIIEPEDFDLRKFLDAVIMVLGWEMENGRSEKSTLWHKTLALYERQTNFSLNPRLQLENLL